MGCKTKECTQWLIALHRYCPCQRPSWKIPPLHDSEQLANQFIYGEDWCACADYSALPPCAKCPRTSLQKKNLILWFSRHFNTRSVCIDLVRKFTTQDTTSSVASYGMLPTSSWSLLLRWYRCLRNSCMKALPKLRLDQKLWLSCQVWLFRQLPWQSRSYAKLLEQTDVLVVTLSKVQKFSKKLCH